MRDDVLLIAKAMDFAARKHETQHGKGSGRKPYINHLAEVAHLIAEATGGNDPELVAAALLHDVAEDQNVSVRELEVLFGREVASLVEEVTDDKSLPRAERKRMQIQTTPDKSDRAKRLKIADKISNLKSLADDPPADWSLGRTRDYLDWARQVVDGARGVSPELEAMFDDAAAQLADRVGNTAA